MFDLILYYLTNFDPGNVILPEGNKVITVEIFVFTRGIYRKDHLNVPKFPIAGRRIHYSI